MTNGIELIGDVPGLKSVPERDDRAGLNEIARRRFLRLPQCERRARQEHGRGVACRHVADPIGTQVVQMIGRTEAPACSERTRLVVRELIGMAAHGEAERLACCSQTGCMLEREGDRLDVDIASRR